MANSNTYANGYGNEGTQLTTYDHIQGAGLKLPVPTLDFINIRSPGKIERIFKAEGNANVLYNKNKPFDLYSKGLLTGQMFVYKNIETGQKSKITTVSQAASQDGVRIRKFLESSAGTRFILKQLVLQRFQAFDETTVYNPKSPIIAALRLASVELDDRPIRHLDTSNIVGGLGSIGRTVGGLFGDGQPVPAPPRSSVASGDSGTDNSDKVVAPLARPDVRDLLRGLTATNAYNAPRYSKLVAKGGGKFFSKLLGARDNFFKNNTLLGGIVPPKQPWKANYRADEETYDLYLNAGKLFDPNQTGIGGGTIGANYSLAVRQRFYNKSENSPDLKRTINVSRITRSTVKSETTSYTGTKSTDVNSQILPKHAILSRNEKSLKYTDLINVSPNGDMEVSDQLLNYKTYLDDTKKFSDTFSDETQTTTKLIIENLNKVIDNIAGNPMTNNLYAIGVTGKKNVKPLQFAKYDNANNNVGMDYLKDIKTTYTDKFSTDTNQLNFPTRLGRKYGKDRFIQPTHNVDYVNSLDVLNKKQFDEQYGNESAYKGFGPDIIKFYFYDVVNEKYIPFSATVKGITDTNSAEWETIEYLGRPDKLYYYKGFTREVSFNFTVNAHSIKELMPMWTRINYLVSLTKPANYTQMASGGFMIPPMVQLTLGDFYKNHFVVIKGCNVVIPEDASWETIPENMSSPNDVWSWGPNRAYEWSSTNNLINTRGDKYASKGRFAQFPRTADINVQMSIMEKDRPKAGRSAWGNSPVPILDKKLLDDLKDTNMSLIGTDFYGNVNGNNIALKLPDFSKNIRYDTDVEAAFEAAFKIPNLTLSNSNQP